jgi:hypothetical protein
MKLLPKKLKKPTLLKRDMDGPPLEGRKGGRVKKQRLEARMIDRELRDYAYR